jgi:hypothetical protein
VRFLHQIAKPEEKERKEFERERSIPEEEIYEFSNFLTFSTTKVGRFSNLCFSPLSLQGIGEEASLGVKGLVKEAPPLSI